MMYSRSSILSLLFILAGALLTTALWKFRPRPEQLTIVDLETPVKVQIATPADHAVQVHSQGVLEAKILTTAAAEVAGKVIHVAKQFEAGGNFRKGDVLLEIDSADYEAALAQTESAVAEAELALAVEQARAEQSLRDWKKLGQEQAPSDLVLRKPQLASANTRVSAALAARAKARRDLDRTKLIAPYDGRVLRKHTDLASFVGIGTPLAEFYANDRLEVRLPISLEDYRFINLAKTINVTLSNEVAGEWRTTEVRLDAAVDRRSRSIHLIAALDSQSGDDPLLVPGLFVSATIDGETLTDVFKLPRSALVGNDRLRIVIPGSTLTKPTLIERAVTVAHAETESILVSEGLKASEQVCLSPVPTFINGMVVTIKEAK